MSSLRKFGESAATAVLDRVGRGVSRVQERKPLSADVLESDDAYLAVFDAPGATRSDVQVRFVDGAVEVQIDRFRDFFEGFEMRFPGRGLSLSGRADLPDGATPDPDGATATLTGSGTLQVRVPKSDDVTDVGVTDESESDDSPLADDDHDAAGSADSDAAALDADDDSGPTDADADDHSDR